MSCSYTLSHEAYCKVVLHTLKFPHASVSGALLGRRGGTQVEIVDALPMFHTTFVTASLLQVAFTQADAYAKTMDCEVCGYYTANEREVDNELSTMAKAVAGKVAANCEHAWCVLSLSLPGSLSPQLPPRLLPCVSAVSF